MANGKTTAPPAALPTPAAPLVCPGDIAMADCKSAMIFSDKTPCFVNALSPNIHCDFKAVWAFVPPPPAGQLSVLLYFHGHKNWVRMDAGGVCVVPDWAKKGDDIVREIPDPNDPEPNNAKKRKILAVAQTQVPNFKPPVFIDMTCAPKRYQLAAASDANKKPIVLAPENAHPVAHGVECGFDPKAVGALGDLVDDCFKHLNALSKSAACGGTPYLPTKPTLTDIKRLFLCGHSGGGVTLTPTAISTLANSTPTDLGLLDCTYGSGNAEYVNFCKTNRAKLGNAAGKSRFICFHTLDKKTVPQLKDELAKKNAELALKGKPPIVKTDAELETQSKTSGTQANVEFQILPGLKTAGFKFDTSVAPPPAGKARGDGINLITGDLAIVETACTLYPIVCIGISSVAHDSFPTRLIPILLKTANVV